MSKLEPDLKNIFIGIDGGGSNVRIAAYTHNLTPITTFTYEHTVNPAIIGRDEAATRLQSAVRMIIQQLDIATDLVRAIGLGIAGADTAHSQSWLEQTFREVLPDAKLVCSADYEIALVAATGEEYGILLLAGTGSVAYGINQKGERMRVGGWGYRIGDEGSGYQIGIAALQHLSHVLDRRADESKLSQSLLAHFDFNSPRADLIAWLYGTQPAPNRDIARLASFVLAAADQNDPNAIKIIHAAADALYTHYITISNTLNMTDPPIVFAGGMLTSPNALSNALISKLSLTEHPQPRNEPVYGAAWLARQRTIF